MVWQHYAVHHGGCESCNWRTRECFENFFSVLRRGKTKKRRVSARTMAGSTPLLELPNKSFPSTTVRWEHHRLLSFRLVKIRKSKYTTYRPHVFTLYGTRFEASLSIEKYFLPLQSNTGAGRGGGVVSPSMLDSRPYLVSRQQPAASIRPNPSPN